MGIYFALMTTSIVMTLSENAGLPLNRDFTTILFIVGIAGYLSLVVLIIGTLFQVIRIIQQQKCDKRIGEEDD